MPIQYTTSSVAMAEAEDIIVILEANCAIPKVNGGPINLMECNDLSV